jgi:hypothetical protein
MLKGVEPHNQIIFRKKLFVGFVFWFGKTSLFKQCKKRVQNCCFNSYNQKNINTGLIRKQWYVLECCLKKWMNWVTNVEPISWTTNTHNSQETLGVDVNGQCLVWNLLTQNNFSSQNKRTSCLTSSTTITMTPNFTMQVVTHG